MKVKIKSKYTDEMTNLSFSFYENGSTVITGTSLQGEPLFTATVALNEVPSPGFVFLKGWSENEGIPEALVSAGIVKLTGKTIPTGYCKAQEAQLLKAD